MTRNNACKTITYMKRKSIPRSSTALLPIVVKCTDCTTNVTEPEDLSDQVGEYT